MYVLKYVTSEQAKTKQTCTGNGFTCSTFRKDNEVNFELPDGTGIACETFIPTFCTAMLVKNAAQLTLVAGDVSKAPARLAAPTRTPRDNREGANTPTIVDLTRGSPRAQASAEKEFESTNIQVDTPERAIAQPLC